MSTLTAASPVVVPSPAGGAPPAETARAARAAVIGVLQVVFEVLDGRRPCDHVAGLVSEPVFAAVTSTLRARGQAVAHAPGRGPAARLRRVHLQMPSPVSASYFGTVDRDGRVRAVAGRIEMVRAEVSGSGRVRPARWKITEFGVL